MLSDLKIARVGVSRLGDLSRRRHPDILDTSGRTWPSVDSYLVTVVGGDPYHQLDATGFDLTDLLTAIG